MVIYFFPSFLSIVIWNRHSHKKHLSNAQWLFLLNLQDSLISQLGWLSVLYFTRALISHAVFEWQTVRNHTEVKPNAARLPDFAGKLSRQMLWPQRGTSTGCAESPWESPYTSNTTQRQAAHFSRDGVRARMQETTQNRVVREHLSGSVCQKPAQASLPLGCWGSTLREVLPLTSPAIWTGFSKGYLGHLEGCLEALCGKTPTSGSHHRTPRRFTENAHGVPGSTLASVSR